jgi:hypothetical protein
MHAPPTALNDAWMKSVPLAASKCDRRQHVSENRRRAHGRCSSRRPSKLSAAAYAHTSDTRLGVGRLASASEADFQ